ncbi:MAG: dehydrogenase [Rhodospirillaceae bacterium]|nr:dehydrogenase [Rhodospirillaceae bacterium]|tara:strand:+ start:2612 stop:4954 length:2343 start_codon:yes stop_codon:yes gene_type:complete
MPDSKLFGKDIKRLEDPVLLRGQANFVDDIFLPGMLHACFVRSPFAHAKINRIDGLAASECEGVIAVLSLKDFRPHLISEYLVVGLPSPSYRQESDRPILAEKEVAYVGEPVAIVVANTRHLAEDAAAMVEVEYDPLPAVNDCQKALKEGSPTARLDAPHNLMAEFLMEYGNVEKAFLDSPHVFSESLMIHRGGSHSIECRGCVVQYEEISDELTLWTSHQMPHSLMRTFVEITGIDENRIRVVTPHVGGGFGPKLVVYQEDVSLLLATKILNRPIKWIEDRREHFTSTTQERDQYWEVEIALDDNGLIQGVRGEVIHDHGAYTARGVNLPYNAAETTSLPYEIENFHMTVKVALTNKVPVTPVRGAGHPQGVFVMERLLDRAASELGIDRAEIRRRNLIPGDKMPYEKPLKTRGGMPVLLDSGNYPKCQHLAEEAADWAGFPSRQEEARKEGRYLGIGISNFVKGTGRGPFEQVTVRIGPSGKVHVYTGGVAIGQGTHTMLAQIVGEQLGADVNNVTLVGGDTHANALGIGTSNSRLAVVAGTSAHVAALKVREKTLKIAAQLLEASEEDLDIEGDQVCIRGTDMKISLGDVANAVAGTPGYALPEGMEPGLEATENVVLDNLAFANGTNIIEVEVDPETGGVEIQKFILAHDSGVIINSMMADGQIHGSAAHGIGNSLFEWMGYDQDANPVTTNFAEYLLVTATEMPNVEVIHNESPSPLNPLGVKGVGECGVVPTPAAVISAVENALQPFGVCIDKAPISPAEICALIHGGRVQGAA